jgi:hypothetical protein
VVGWKRIVVTVGEKIGKEHLTYGQGVCAELVAMATISLADNFGLPVSTTHVLSSGVAGTMARQQERTADDDHSQHRCRLSVYAASRCSALRDPILGFPPVQSLNHKSELIRIFEFKFERVRPASEILSLTPVRQSFESSAPAPVLTTIRTGGQVQRISVRTS